MRRCINNGLGMFIIAVVPSLAKEESGWWPAGLYSVVKRKANCGGKYSGKCGGLKGL